MRRLLIVALAMAAAACGTASTSSTGGPAASPAASNTLQLIQKPSLNGTALSDSAGHTLYLYKLDIAGKPTCTGGCLGSWPVVPAGTSLPTLPSGLSGTLGSVAATAGGQQLTYDGWPLYTFTGDSGSGDATGQGINNFAAITSSTQPNPGAGAAATSAPAATAPPAATSNSGAYNYN